MHHRLVVLAALLALCIVAVVPAVSAPQMITYQGVLTDNLGNPLSGSHNLIFKIYRDSLSTTPILWSETHTGVSVTNGLFNVILGRSTSIPLSIFDIDQRWLGITVDSDAEMTPRMRFTSAPWAFHAAIADSALATSGGGSGWTISGSDMYSTVSGNVGIGATAPGKKLQVGNTSTSNSEGMIRLASRSGTNGSNRAWDIGVPETDGVSSGYGYSFVVDDVALGTDPEFMVKWGSGRVGIGTNAPARKLHIDCANVEDGVRIDWGSDYPSVYGELKRTLGTGLIINSCAGGGGWADINFQTDGVTRAYITSTGYFGIGTSAPTAMLDVAGTAKVQVLQITGADVAEKFPIREKVEPGMVVAIDPDRAGELCVAKGEYNRRVAGVISGAGNLPAGAILGNLPGHEDAPPVALTGRVWVKCNTSAGAIEPGDMLTTSDQAGTAMKAADPQRATGAIIGKAMTALRDGSGLVLTLVSLQ